MNKPTTAAEAFKFVAFLEEGLNIMNSHIPTTVNHGGCGVFAQMFDDKLNEVGIEHQIVGIFPRKEEALPQRWIEEVDNLNKLRNNSSETNLSKAIPPHIVVGISGLYFDITGVSNMAVLFSRKNVYSLTREQLDALVEKGKGWNSEFDRECIPLMRKELDELFAKYDDFHPGSLGLPQLSTHLTDNTIREKRKADVISLLIEQLTK